ncbi:hypothetical protein QBC46DRAFT_458016 [Diplogelasinospora grovesii]|uniref:HMG box domain-containing protein n=1 Tax=Diplogelasinospora grovesii TaxID=303347 RepID=A0AAN6S6I3_9PEZI|nr:hypothetical protein QBC46DRAFT_458016 [Diplogelasinospora grovesii]
MDHTTPPSPAPSRPDPSLLPSGFDELVQHNATASYSRDTTTLAMEQIQLVHDISQPGSRFGTPVPQSQQASPQGYDTVMMYQHSPSNSQLQSYQTQSTYSHDGSPYGPIPESQPYSTPATSPPTPAQRSAEMLNARNGVVMSKALGPRSTRIEKASQKKKKKERAKTTKSLMTLDRPLSQLTEGSQVTVADIESYVSRSAEIRRQEIETGKNPGRVKRPMNAFMLYRKAFQQRAKEWASQHNHQVVSRVCGLSWPLESEQLREQYKAWAEIERDNHQKAHPDYKFTPSKPQKQKFKDAHLDDSDGSDLEDFDWAGRSGSRNRSTTRTPNCNDLDGDYIPSRPVYGGGGMSNGMGMSHHGRSSAFHEYSPPGKMMPSLYDHHRDTSLQSQYYEAAARNSSSHRQQLQHGNMLSDVLSMRKGTPSPSLAFPPQHGQGGLQGYDMDQYRYHAHPHGLSHDDSPLMEQLQLTSTQPHLLENNRVDPSLEGGHFMNSNNIDMFGLGDGGGALDGHGHQTWGVPPSMAEGQYSETFMGMGLEDTLAFERENDVLRGSDGAWQTQTLPDSGQFDMSWADASPRVDER